MTDKITEPIAPDVMSPAPLGPLSGNWHDDDAQVYEDDFLHADLGPVDHKGMPHPVAELKPVTRLLTRSVVVGTVNGALQDPIMLLPADINRKSLVLQTISATTVSFRLASDKSGCFNGENLYAFGATVTTIPNHTGAVWAYSVDASTATIVVVSVTE